jgi:hypothetical protein
LQTHSNGLFCYLCQKTIKCKISFTKKHKYEVNNLRNKKLKENDKVWENGYINSRMNSPRDSEQKVNGLRAIFCLQYYSPNDEQQLKLLKRSSDESSSTEAPTTSTRSPAQGQKEVPMLRPPNPAKGHAEVKPTAHPSSVYDAIKRLLTIEDLQVCVSTAFSTFRSDAFFALLAFCAREILPIYSARRVNGIFQLPAELFLRFSPPPLSSPRQSSRVPITLRALQDVILPY